MVARRARGEPLELILGWAEFCGLRIAVEPGVFVPRLRTEFLVEKAGEASRTPGLARERGGSAKPPTVLDICCGAGAVGAALAERIVAIDLYATDVDPAAVACARRNLAGAGARVFAGDLYEPLPTRLRGRFDLIIANAPYVPSDEVELMPREARLYENLVALDGGPDGLEIQRRIAAEAPGWLALGGHLLIETSEAQAETTAEIVISANFAAQITRSPELDATVVVGTLPE